MTDEEIIARYNAYRAENQHTWLNKVERDIGVSRNVLRRLGKQGKIKLPPPLPISACSRLARIQGGWGKNFKLPGSPSYD